MGRSSCASSLSVRPVARNEAAVQFFHALGFGTLGHIEMFQMFSDRKWRQGSALPAGTSRCRRHSGAGELLDDGFEAVGTAVEDAEVRQPVSVPQRTELIRDLTQRTDEEERAIEHDVL